MEAEQLEQIGTALQCLGRTIQRTFPKVGRIGSQENEDLILADLLPGDSGCYVDIGAGDPIDNSNTWQFYKRGWRGLLIEPCMEFHYRLKRLREGDFVWPTAAGDYEGWSTMRICGAVSSLRPDWNFQERGVAYVEVFPTAAILDKPDFRNIRDNCRFCSIDVEGFERHVLLGIDWTVFKPEVLCVEYAVHNVSPPNNDLSGEWEGIVLAQGYQEVAKTGLNRIYKLGP